MFERNDTVIAILKEKFGKDISMFESSFLSKAIQSRMNQTRCQTIVDYTGKLIDNELELSKLMDQLTNTYSEFFRNPLTFNCLEQIILPELFKKKESGKHKEIRIWSAACASGQEACSITMLCDEYADFIKPGLIYRIFATDKSPEAIADAQEGVYQSMNLNKVTLKRLQMYFTAKDDLYLISSSIKNQIDFSVFDLLSDQDNSPPASIYGNFDLIFCSNLLFYYQPEYRKRILEKIGHNLASGGYLVTGEAEREIIKEQNYREVFINSAIFQKRQ